VSEGREGAQVHFQVISDGVGGELGAMSESLS